MHIHSNQTPPPIEELRLTKVDKPMERGRYTWEKKYSVVAIYLQNGSLRDTEAKTDVPATTIENWRKSEWWPNLVNQIKQASVAQLDNKLTRLVNKSLGVIEDRLDNGELVMNNKTGEMVRKPVGIRDATRAASELMQRQINLNKNMNEVETKRETIQETLSALAKEFAKIYTKKQEDNTINLEEVEDAVYEERAPGL